LAGGTAKLLRSTTMRMTLNLLDAFARCPQKAFLKCTGETGHVTEYEVLTQQAAEAYQRKCVQRICEQYAPGEILSTPPSLDNIARRRHRLILTISLRRNDPPSLS